MTSETGASLLLVTHDLDVAARLCRNLAVMYAGEIIERGLYPIPGTVPQLCDLALGCRFHPRCPHASELCRQTAPTLFRTSVHESLLPVDASSDQLRSAVHSGPVTI